MKPLAAVLLTLVLACATVDSTYAQGAAVREVLSNDSIIKLAKAGFKESTIISLIRTSPVSFDITTAKLVVLKKNNVSEKIITAMIERQTLNVGAPATGGLALNDDEFFRQDDEEFFRGARPRVPGLNGAPGQADPLPQDNDTSIFGSRSGGRSRTESRGMGGTGSSSGQSETLGSASVKILRPPSENGGSGEPKLERAPKLDNQAVLDLIQAGFSEGSIMRKIERSQVDFDVSPKAVAELRKQRISETVIKAMAEAMGVELK
jgi:hypothetical protein